VVNLAFAAEARKADLRTKGEKRMRKGNLGQIKISGVACLREGFEERTAVEVGEKRSREGKTQGGVIKIGVLTCF